MKNKFTYQALLALAVISVYGFTSIYPSYAGEGHEHDKQEEPSSKHEKGDGHDHGEENGEGHEHDKQEGPSDKHEEGDDHDHGEENGEDHGEEAKLSEKAIEDSGIKLMEASEGIVDQTLLLTGRITLNQNKTASVKARFPGIIKEVTKAQGENVKAGEVLALIESNESLQVYAVKAPIDGVVLSRSINIGDTAGDAAMFTIADMNELWAEFHVFSQDADLVKSGIPINVSTSECEKAQTTTIQSVLPITEASSQTLLARSTIKNVDSHWLPGMSVRGDVVVESRDVPVAIKTSALQQMEGKTVIFVKEADGAFKARPVKMGLQSKNWTEITEGLKSGETYVSEGSFVVKADIGKAGAEHAH